MIRYSFGVGIGLQPPNHKLIGWLKTFEDYFTSQVRSILDKSVLYLSTFKDLRFIWSEMSFLHRWWKDATPEQKKNLTILINEGRFELCGGSWVMTDEATPYFWATIDNLIEGHQFVKNIFNVTPKSSWLEFFNLEVFIKISYFVEKN